MGIGAPVSFNTREHYMDNKVRTEQFENREDEEDQLDEEIGG